MRAKDLIESAYRYAMDGDDESRRRSHGRVAQALEDLIDPDAIDLKSIYTTMASVEHRALVFYAAQVTVELAHLGWDAESAFAQLGPIHMSPGEQRAVDRYLRELRDERLGDDPATGIDDQ